MASPSGTVDLAGLTQEIRRGLSAGDLGMAEPAFRQLTENIARAILRAVSATQVQSPEFGEEDRGS